MTWSGRFAAFALSMLLMVGVSVSVGALPASAAITTLCSGYTSCAKAGMGNSGYSAVSKTMFWRMYTGHNCTNYAAYRMVQAGLPNARPWTGSGNATNWGSAMSSRTTSVPAVGAIAWWHAGVKPAGSAGHVAYVERVVSPNEIIVSQDSWNGDFSWTRILRSGTGWPSGFVHFKDAQLLNTKAPTVTGSAKVGSTLTAAPGTWSQADAAFSYQWMQDGAPISGANTATLVPQLAQQGKKITIRVTAVKLGFPNTPALSAPTAIVQPGALTNTDKPVVTGEARVGETLAVTPGTWNPAPDQVTYQWLAGEDPIPGATQSTLAVDVTRAGAALSVTVTAVKSGYAPVSTRSSPSQPVTPGRLTLKSPPRLAGSAQPGRTLTVALPDAPPQSSVTVQWLRGTAPVAGATGGNYRLTGADAGSRVLARVTVTRPGYQTLTTSTAWSAVVRATPVVRVVTQRGKRRLAVAASVTAAGLSPVTGVLQVRSRGKVLRQAALSRGVARLVITRLPKGTRTFRFRYVGSTKVTGAIVQRRLRIL